jgi:alkanesulfonate monooxygenase SsuD/methylene tetrahydromethanopterin reductase-like flavin-dependent oxidoreductase (luciferase family)
LAAATERIRLGPLVACTAFAAPGLLARKAAAVQEISNGRLVLGLGAGWNETEFRAFGIPFDHRASRFGEAFEIIRRLLVGERVTYEGRFEWAQDAVLLPRPATRVPLMIGSTGERVLRIALPHADVWNVWYDWYGNTPDGFARENARVSVFVQEAGREPADVLRSATVFVTFEHGRRDRPHTLDVPPLMGSPEAIATGLADLAAAGVDEAILVVSPINERVIRSLGEVIATLDS